MELDLKNKNLKIILLIFLYLLVFYFLIFKNILKLADKSASNKPRFVRLILFNFYLKIWNVTHLFFYSIIYIYWYLISSLNSISFSFLKI